jgi:hypothetical protein
MTTAGIIAQVASLQAVDFVFQPLYAGTVQMVPLVDSCSLVEMAGAFESRAGLEPAGGYAGLVLERYNFGDLRLYLAGEQLPWPGRDVPLLGCQCGEWGCWPLQARISIADRVVEWSGFGQPHRPGRDYTGFRPFRFSEQQYRNAVTAAASRSR